MKDNYAPMSDLRGYLPDKKVRNIIEQGKNVRDKLIMKTLRATGGRVSEVVSKPHGITPEDLVPEENVIIMRTLKRKHKRRGLPAPPPERRVVIPSWLMLELVDFAKSTLPNSPIFPITRQRVFQIVREAGANAKVIKVGKKRIHPHHLRQRPDTQQSMGSQQEGCTLLR
jgi:site-specific recombinase XerD